MAIIFPNVSQALKEVYRLHVVMPKMTIIPSWFDHHCKGGIVSFWARQKFPIVAVAFILKKDAIIRNIRLYINGCDACYFSRHVYCPFVKGEHVLLFDLRNVLEAKEWPILDTFLVYKWNCVEVECECYYDFLDDVGRRSNVTHCGAYVYKRETNMEDILFKCPNSLKGTLPIVDNPRKRKHGVRKLKPKSIRKNN